jgi:hypothetical protein
MDVPAQLRGELLNWGDGFQGVGISVLHSALYSI